MGQGTGRRV